MSFYNYTRNKLQKTTRRPRKRLGQNFLVDQRVLDEIVKSAELSPEDLILEIGAGTGILTEKIAQSAGKVVAVELDDELFGMLQSTFTNNSKVILIHEDILDMDIANILKSEQKDNFKIKIMGNIPYYITTPILMKLLEDCTAVPIQMIVMLVQKEVGLRIVASPGTKDYGALSVAIAYRADAEIITDIPAESFYPKPKVDSVLIRLNLRPIPSVDVQDEKLFFQIVRAAFQQRRKTLRNALLIAGSSGKYKISADSIDSAFHILSFDPKRRGETLSCEEFGHLANAIYDILSE